MRGEVAIVGYGETPVSRANVDKGEQRLTAEEYYSWAAELALESAGLSKDDLEGQGLGVIGAEWPHSEIWSTEIVQNLGLNPKLLLRADHGGANAAALLVQSSMAIHSGLVDTVLCVGADSPMSIQNGASSRTWRYELDYERPFGMMGPNSMVALIMRRHMHQYGTKPEQTGKISVTQRFHASLNPNAYLKTPIKLDDYLNSRLISDPIRLLDACISVNGGLAFIVTSRRKARRLTDKPVYVLGFGENHTHSRADVTITGIADASRDAFKMAKVRKSEISFFQPYDDYSIIVLVQLEDAGFCKKGDGGKFVEQTDLTLNGQLPVNTGGGQLSAGQPGMAGGFVHIVEAVRQLRGEGGKRQVKNARTGLVTGLGGLAFASNFANYYTLILSSEV